MVISGCVTVHVVLHAGSLYFNLKRFAHFIITVIKLSLVVWDFNTYLQCCLLVQSGIYMNNILNMAKMLCFSFTSKILHQIKLILNGDEIFVFLWISTYFQVYWAWKYIFATWVLQGIASICDTFRWLLKKSPSLMGWTNCKSFYYKHPSVCMCVFCMDGCMQCVRWQDTMASQSHRINSKRWRRIERGRRGKRRGAAGKEREQWTE